MQSWISKASSLDITSKKNIISDILQTQSHEKAD